MELTEETAKELTKALEGFDESVNVFSTSIERGIRVDGKASDLIRKLTEELQKFNEIQAQKE